jgi:hypothetical protein
MAPTPTTYSLRSQRPPTTFVERSIRLTTTREHPIRVETATERPVRARRVSTKVAVNKDIEATQAQLAAKAVIEAFQPVIQALTLQLTQLTVALEEQRIDFARQYKALQAEFTALPYLVRVYCKGF